MPRLSDARKAMDRINNAATEDAAEVEDHLAAIAAAWSLDPVELEEEVQYAARAMYMVLVEVGPATALATCYVAGLCAGLAYSEGWAEEPTEEGE